MKIAEYNDMMAHLTRRQKFAFGGVSSNDAILPKPNPLSPQERNQKVFNDYVGRMKKYLGAGVNMPEWFVKDLIFKKAEELGVELKAGGGRIGLRAGAGLASYPVFRGRSGADNLKAWRGAEMKETLPKITSTGLALEKLPEASFITKDEDPAERVEEKIIDEKIIPPSDEDPNDPKLDPEKMNELFNLVQDVDTLNKLRKEATDIFKKRMTGDPGGKGTFTGSIEEGRKSIAPHGFIPKDKSTLALFRNNKNLEGLETKVYSLIDFRKTPDLFENRVTDLGKRIDLEGYYNPAEIAELFGLKTASGVIDAIRLKNIPYEKIGAFKAVKLSDFINSQRETIEKFKNVAPVDQMTFARTNFLSELGGNIYKRFRDLKLPGKMPPVVKKIYDKYSLQKIEGGHPFPIEFFTKQFGAEGTLKEERQFEWIYRNRDKLIDKDNIVFQSKALNSKGGPFYNAIGDLKEQYKILSPLVDKYEGQGPVTNKEDIKTIEEANIKIMKIVADSETAVKDWLNKTGKYKNREDTETDFLSMERMKEGGVHGALFNTDTGEVSLYTAAGEGAGTATGAVVREGPPHTYEKLNLASQYLDIIENIIGDENEKKIFIDYINDKILPRYEKGGPVYGKYAKQIAGIS